MRRRITRWWRRLRGYVTSQRTLGGDRLQPDSLPRIGWASDRADYVACLGSDIRGRHCREREIGERRTWRALCAYCRSPRDLVVSSGVWLGGNVNLREGLVCPVCCLSNRLRLLFKATEERFRTREELRRQRVFVAERLTVFHRRLSARFDDLTGSEYLGPDCTPGQLRRIGLRSVRHEDLHQLSFGDKSFDLVIHADVLEHVPEPRQVLSELLRVTRPGGAMYFTVPFLQDRKEDEVRASLLHDGTTIHHLPPIYHGNPVNPEGSLTYRTFGWSLLDTLRAVGFDSADVGVLADTALGFTSSNSPGTDFMEPVVFRALRFA